MSRRPDSIGFFWQDLAKVGGKGARGERILGPMPPIPETGWKPPRDFPNLSAAKVIGFDTETKDLELLSAGPGWARNAGHIIGVSLAVEDGTSWYFPIRHETQSEMNMDAEQVLRFCGHVLGDNRPKVGANLIYDVGWMQHEGYKVRGRLYDVQFAEALLNSETPDVSLEGLSQRYLGIGKESSILYDWLASWMGGKASDRQRANMWRSPPSLAGPYAESDAALPIRILEKQWAAMRRRGVLDLFDLECRLIPLLVAMRFRGACVNVNKADEIYSELGDDLLRIEATIKQIAGIAVNPNAGESIKNAFVKLSIPCPTVIDKKTGKEKMSFAAPLLEEIPHALPEAILEYRRVAKVRNTFIKGYIIDKHVNGRVHCSFNPLKSDEGGARSGRFSSSDPNLQNIPIRSDIGRRVRTAFEVGLGHRWRKFDHSQVEYRMLANHAVGEGADELRRFYNANPDIDYHELIIEMIRKATGIILDRRSAKNINFGLIYGMSEPKLSADLGLTKKAGSQLFKDYHKSAPFVRATMEDAENEVHRLGYVTTVLGRKSDFNMWGPKEYVAGRPAMQYEAARDKWGVYNIERSFTHKAVNRKLQGGAADVMKKGMVDAYEAGLFADDACGIPMLTVHDELDFEDENDLDNPAWLELMRVMETCIPSLRIPLKVDQKIGKSWGDAD